MANERTSDGQTATSPSNPKSDPIGEAKAEARTAAEELKAEAADQMDKARSEISDEARSFASDQKDFAAGQLGSIADAVTRVAEELDQQNQMSLARYAREIGKGMRGLSDTARDSSVDELLDKAQSFGRRNPAAFLGAAALMGFAASRFLTASAHRHQTTAAITRSSDDTRSPMAPH